MILDRAWIEAHIPQQGTMCLLDEVLNWDAQQLLCRSGTHRLADHPLRTHGRVTSVSLIEYAAQAAALHGALLRSLPTASATQPKPTLGTGAGFGVLASARSVDLVVPNLDEVAGDLLVHARCLHSDARAALYAFAVGEADRGLCSATATLEHATLARGRLSVWFDGAALSLEREHAR